MKSLFLFALGISAYGQAIVNCNIVGGAPGPVWSQAQLTCDLATGSAPIASATAVLDGADPFQFRTQPGSDTLVFGRTAANSTTHATNAITLWFATGQDWKALPWKVNTVPLAVFADAGKAQTANIGDTVLLDGSKSGGSGPLTYSWRFVSTPAGSLPILRWADTAFPSFVADAAGEHVLRLTVTSGGAADEAMVRVRVRALDEIDVSDSPWASPGCPVSFKVFIGSTKDHPVTVKMEQHPTKAIDMPSSVVIPTGKVEALVSFSMPKAYFIPPWVYVTFSADGFDSSGFMSINETTGPCFGVTN